MLKSVIGTLAALFLAAASARAEDPPKQPPSDVQKFKDPSRPGQLEPGQTRLKTASDEARPEFLVIEERRGEERSYLVVERKDLDAFRKGSPLRSVAFKGEGDEEPDDVEEEEPSGEESSAERPSYRILARFATEGKAERKAELLRSQEEKACERRAQRKAEEEARRKEREEKRKAGEEAPPPPKKRKLF